MCRRRHRASQRRHGTPADSAAYASLHDHRSKDLAWDAFEAPDAASLVWMELASPWSRVRVWLTDLADELLASGQVSLAPALDQPRLDHRLRSPRSSLDFSVPL